MQVAEEQGCSCKDLTPLQQLQEGWRISLCLAEHAPAQDSALSGDKDFSVLACLHIFHAECWAVCFAMSSAVAVKAAAHKDSGALQIFPPTPPWGGWAVWVSCNPVTPGKSWVPNFRLQIAWASTRAHRVAKTA